MQARQKFLLAGSRILSGHRHSRAGGNPFGLPSLKKAAAQQQWIPAFAGMTA
ncbi:hypothetical protein ACLB0R_08765 [Sphingomonas sp. GlSt437]|uniref:hypothetical protein n=1 Tax=Sphingomonas sp. GlSt437 TaxID=3389970 RepID=UPI003EBDDC8C